MISRRGAAPIATALVLLLLVLAQPGGCRLHRQQVQQAQQKQQGQNKQQAQQSHNKQQLQHSSNKQQGTDGEDKGDFFLIPALIGLAALSKVQEAQRQQQQQQVTVTTVPTITSTTATTKYYSPRQSSTTAGSSSSSSSGGAVLAPTGSSSAGDLGVITVIPAKSSQNVAQAVAQDDSDVTETTTTVVEIINDPDDTHPDAPQPTVTVNNDTLVVQIPTGSQEPIVDETLDDDTEVDITVNPNTPTAPLNPTPAVPQNPPPLTPGLEPAITTSKPQPLPIQLLSNNVTAPPPRIFGPAGAKNKILIGCALPFEGDQAVVGEAVYNAAAMALQNELSKLLPGYTVNFTCINSKCIDIPAYNAVYQLAEQKAVAVLGEVCSGASVAAAGVANSKKIPVISPSSTSPSLSQPDFFFRTVPSDTYQGEAAADLLHNQGHKNIGLIYEDTPYGYGLGFSIIAAFTPYGGNVPVVYMFKRGSGNVTEALGKMMAGQKDGEFPLDAVFVATNNLTFVADFLVAAQAGGLDVPIYSGDSAANPELRELVGERKVNWDGFTVIAPYPGDKEFLSTFRSYLSKIPKANSLAGESVYAARGYDAMTAVLRAYAAAAQPKDGAAVASALGKLNYDGMSGQISFDQYGDLIGNNMTYIYGKRDADGIKTIDFVVDTNPRVTDADDAAEATADVADDNLTDD